MIFLDMTQQQVEHLKSILEHDAVKARSAINFAHTCAKYDDYTGKPFHGFPSFEAAIKNYTYWLEMSESILAELRTHAG